MGYKILKFEGRRNTISKQTFVAGLCVVGTTDLVTSYIVIYSSTKWYWEHGENALVLISEKFLVPPAFSFRPLKHLLAALEAEHRHGYVASHDTEHHPPEDLKCVIGTAEQAEEPVVARIHILVVAAFETDLAMALQVDQLANDPHRDPAPTELLARLVLAVPEDKDCIDPLICWILNDVFERHGTFWEFVNEPGFQYSFSLMRNLHPEHDCPCFSVCLLLRVLQTSKHNRA